MHYIKVKGVFAALGMALSMAAAVPALAADNGFYVGGSAGTTKWNIGPTDVLATGSIENNNTGYKIFGGYDFTKNWGLELGYADLGKYEFKGTYGGANVKGDVKITAYSLVGVGTFPITDDLAVFGKLGMYSWDAKASVNSGSINNSATGTGSNGLYGVGMKFNFTDHFSVRGEWERFHDSSNPIDLISVGVAYKF